MDLSSRLIRSLTAYLEIKMEKGPAIMAEFPALPLWIDAYLADTLHLTDAQNGMYLKLLMLMWRTSGCRVPNDDAWLAKRFTNVQALREVIVEFCQCDGNWITQGRLTDEYNWVRQKSRKRSVSAKSRWGQEKDLCNWNAPIPIPIPISKELDSSSNGDGGFSVFWSSYPRKVAKLAAEKAFARAIRTTSLQTMLAALAADKETWTEEKYTPHPATWLNQGRYLDRQSAASAKPFYRPPLNGATKHADQRKDFEAASTKTESLLDESAGIRDEDAAGLGNGRSRHH